MIWHELTIVPPVRRLVLRLADPRVFLSSKSAAAWRKHRHGRTVSATLFSIFDAARQVRATSRAHLSECGLKAIDLTVRPT